MDRLEAMSVFLAAAAAGSLSAAGRKLGKPLTTVSRNVSELEAHLKTQLFHRSSRKLSLTDEGRSYAAACRRILEDVREAERLAAVDQDDLKGDLAITAPILFGRLHVLPIVAEFLKLHPGVNVQLLLADRTTDLLEEQIDLAVRVRNLPDSSLIALRVGSIRRVFCASPGYLAAHGTPRIPADLASHDCVTYAGWMSTDTWTFRVNGLEVGLPVRTRLLVSTAEAALDAAVAGVGIACALSHQIAGSVQKGELAVVLRRFEPAPLAVSLV